MRWADVWERGCITCDKLLLKMSIHLNKLKKTWNSVKWNPPSLLCPPVAQTDKGKLRIDVEFCLPMKMLIQKGIKMYIIQANLGCLKLCPDLYSLTLKMFFYRMKVFEIVNKTNINEVGFTWKYYFCLSNSKSNI